MVAHQHIRTTYSIFTKLPARRSEELWGGSMSLVVNTNLQATNSLNRLGNTNQALGKVFERLSSGLRINRAADDAAGLGMAESFDAEYRGMRQAGRNANDAISLVQVAEGAYNEIANILKRMKELAVQSSSETLGSTERNYITDESDQLTDEIFRIAQVTEFNGVSLLAGAVSAVAVQIGASSSANDRISIELTDWSKDTIIANASAANMQFEFGTVSGAQATLATLDVFLASVNSDRSQLGSIQNRLESTLRNITTYTENIAAAKSRILDADFAYETAQLAKYQILQQSGVAVLGQANSVNQAALRLLG